MTEQQSREGQMPEFVTEYGRGFSVGLDKGQEQIDALRHELEALEGQRRANEALLLNVQDLRNEIATLEEAGLQHGLQWARDREEKKALRHELEQAQATISQHLLRLVLLEADKARLEDEADHREHRLQHAEHELEQAQAETRQAERERDSVNDLLTEAEARLEAAEAALRRIASERHTIEWACDVALAALTAPPAGEAQE